MQYTGRLVLTVLLLMLLSACTTTTGDNTGKGRDSAEYHKILGASALDENNPTEALKEFLQAEEFDDSDPEIQAGLAQAYWQKQAYELAEKHMQRAIKLSNDDPKYHHNLAALYLSTERYDEAISSFKTAAENLLFDRPEMAWTAIGLANYQKQDYPAAQSAYIKALKLNPRYYRASYHLGELLYNQDRPAEALDAFTKTVELAPGLVPGHYWQGLSYLKLGEEAKARAAFLEVIRLDPQGKEAGYSRDYLKKLK